MLSKRLASVLFVVIPFACISKADTDGLMQKWLQLESQKGKLQTEWAERKAELERRQKLLVAEQSSLNEVLSQTADVRSDTDERRKSLLTDQERLEQEQALMAEEVKKAKTSLQSIQFRLPPPLAAEVDGKMKSLESELTASEKLERLLSMYKLINEFDRRVALNRATVEVPVAGQDAPRSLRVTQVYLGLTQGWYLSEDASEYGYGRATALGWKWWSNQEAENELGQKLDPREIKTLINIMENPALANLVSLPVKLEVKDN
jgi:hypothetical protein